MCVLLVVLSAGRDYVGVLEVLTFGVSSYNGDTQCVNISILDDAIFEKNENFYVHISSEVDVEIHQQYAPVYIIDDESKIMSRFFLK